MGITVGEVLPEVHVVGIVQRLSVRDLAVALLLSEDYAGFHRLLNELLNSGRISKKDYEELSSLTARLILEGSDNRIPHVLDVARRLEEAIMASKAPTLPLTRITRMILSEDFAGLHRFLDKLFNDGRLSREEYEKVSSLVARIMLEEHIDEKIRLIREINSVVGVVDES